MEDGDLSSNDGQTQKEGKENEKVGDGVSSLQVYTSKSQLSCYFLSDSIPRPPPKVQLGLGSPFGATDLLTLLNLTIAQRLYTLCWMICERQHLPVTHAYLLDSRTSIVLDPQTTCMLLTERKATLFPKGCACGGPSKLAAGCPSIGKPIT
jgi:hypothetical protein